MKVVGAGSGKIGRVCAKILVAVVIVACRRSGR